MHIPFVTTWDRTLVFANLFVFSQLSLMLTVNFCLFEPGFFYSILCSDCCFLLTSLQKISLLFFISWYTYQIFSNSWYIDKKTKFRSNFVTIVICICHNYTYPNIWNNYTWSVWYVSKCILSTVEPFKLVTFWKQKTKQT